MDRGEGTEIQASPATSGKFELDRISSSKIKLLKKTRCFLKTWEHQKLENNEESD